jgi:hypothetical protein
MKKKKSIKAAVKFSARAPLIGPLIRAARGAKANSKVKALWTKVSEYFTRPQRKIFQSFLANPGDSTIRSKVTDLLTRKLRSSPAFRQLLERYSGLTPTRPRKISRKVPPKKAAKRKAAPKKAASKNASPKKGRLIKIPPKKAAPKKAPQKKVDRPVPDPWIGYSIPNSAPHYEPFGEFYGRNRGNYPDSGGGRWVYHRTPLYYKPGFGVSDAEPEPPKPVTCNFQASMEDPALLNRVLAITVIISRELIEVTANALYAAAAASVDAHQDLSLTCRPVRDFSVIGAKTISQTVPQPGQPVTLAFNGLCTALGPCELAIDVWQGQLPVCSLTLKPQCVTTRAGSNLLSIKAIAKTTMPLPKPVHQLRINERVSGKNTYYDFVLDSPGLGILENFDPVRIDGDRDIYIQSLYSEIETMWQLAVTEPKRFQQRIRTKGAQLFSTLIPNDLKDILWQQKDEIDSIMVISTEPFIPWELVLLKDPASKKPSPGDKFLCEMGLLRWLYGWQPTENLLIRETMARYVIPDYLNPARKLTAPDLEKTYLEKNLGATKVVPTADEVEKILNERSGFDLLHFSCHAEVETDNIVNGKLILQDEPAGNQFVDTYLTQDVVEELEEFADPRPLIFLSACNAGKLGKKLSGFGGFAKAFLDAGAGAFVGALWSIEENAAYVFMKAWYDQLKAGKTLAEATVLARQQASSEGDATYLAYVVYGHPNATVGFT